MQTSKRMPCKCKTEEQHFQLRVGWKDVNEFFPGLQAAATAVNTLPATIHRTRHAKLVRVWRPWQSTNTPSRISRKTPCGAWSSTRPSVSWWHTRSTPGTPIHLINNGWKGNAFLRKAILALQICVWNYFCVFLVIFRANSEHRVQFFCFCFLNARWLSDENVNPVKD